VRGCIYDKPTRDVLPVESVEADGDKWCDEWLLRGGLMLPVTICHLPLGADLTWAICAVTLGGFERAIGPRIGTGRWTRNDWSITKRNWPRGARN
jgi:hypothetical protein